MAITPVIGSFLKERYGTIDTSVMVGYFDFCFLIFIFLFNCGPFVFQENKKFE
jgi:hypothetical protein